MSRPGKSTVCSFTPCGRGVLAQGLCSRHYQQKRNGKELTVGRAYYDRQGEASPICSIDDCINPPIRQHMCGKHYRQDVKNRAASSGTVCQIDECPRPLRGSTKYCDYHRVKVSRGDNEIVVIRCIQPNCGVPILSGRWRKCEEHMGKCGVEGCTEKSKASKLYCNMHYKRLNSKGTLGTPGRTLRERGTGTNWYKRKDGYVVRQRTVNGTTVHQKQHRHHMEIFLGRPLLKNENVHHKNGVRHDNRIENLELWSKSQPPGQRAKDKLDWAREIIALYEKDEDKL